MHPFHLSRHGGANERGVSASITKLRRRRTGTLPIRGISREWAKTLSSVHSVSLW